MCLNSAISKISFDSTEATYILLRPFTTLPYLIQKHIAIPMPAEKIRTVRTITIIKSNPADVILDDGAERTADNVFEEGLEVGRLFGESVG